jgi:hypothetical protein
VDDSPLYTLATVDESTRIHEGSVVKDENSTIPSIAAVEVKSDTKLQVDTTMTVSAHSSKSSEDESNDSDIDTNLPNEENTVKTRMESTDGPHISRVDGVGTVVVTPAVGSEGIKNDEDSKAPDTEALLSPPLEDDDDDWATVEVRTRGNRRKTTERNNNNGRSNSLYGPNGGKKKDKAPRNTETRKRNIRRKMARDIIFSVLDNVHEQVVKRSLQQHLRRSQQSAPRPVPNAWGTIQATKTGSPANHESETNTQKNQRPGVDTREGVTMRDITTGKSNDSTKTLQVAPQRGYAHPPRQAADAAMKRDREKASVGTADQNTAPTQTETLSAETETLSTKNVLATSGVAAGESSSNESVDATKPQNNSNQSQETQISPPLPTLLSPGNSATSSVASSLEAPHAVHHNHLSYVGNESDVGYHLLRVCDRLTRDIGHFMKRREEALKMRRHERKLVLSALQDSLTVSVIKLKPRIVSDFSPHPFQ